MHSSKHPFSKSHLSFESFQQSIDFPQQSGESQQQSLESDHELLVTQYQFIHRSQQSSHQQNQDLSSSNTSHLQKQKQTENVFKITTSPLTCEIITGKVIKNLLTKYRIYSVCTKYSEQLVKLKDLLSANLLNHDDSDQFLYEIAMAKAILAVHIMHLIKKGWTDESKCSLKKLVESLITDFQSKTLNPKALLIAKRYLLSYFTTGIYINTLLLQQTRYTQTERSYEQVIASKFLFQAIGTQSKQTSKYKRMTFVPTYLVTSKIFKMLMDTNEISIWWGLQGVGKSSSIILFRCLSEIIVSFRTLQKTASQSIKQKYKSLNYFLLDLRITKLIYWNINLNETAVEISSIITQQCYQIFTGNQKLFFEQFDDEKDTTNPYKQFTINTTKMRFIKNIYYQYFDIGIKCILIIDNINLLFSLHRKQEFRMKNILQRRNLRDQLNQQKDNTKIQQIRIKISKLDEEIQTGQNQHKFQRNKIDLISSVLRQIISHFRIITYLSSVNLEIQLLDKISLNNQKNTKIYPRSITITPYMNCESFKFDIAEFILLQGQNCGFFKSLEKSIRIHAQATQNILNGEIYELIQEEASENQSLGENYELIQEEASQNQFDSQIDKSMKYRSEFIKSIELQRASELEKVKRLKCCLILKQQILVQLMKLEPAGMTPYVISQYFKCLQIEKKKVQNSQLKLKQHSSVVQNPKILSLSKTIMRISANYINEVYKQMKSFIQKDGNRKLIMLKLLLESVLISCQTQNLKGYYKPIALKPPFKIDHYNQSTYIDRAIFSYSRTQNKIYCNVHPLIISQIIERFDHQLYGMLLIKNSLILKLLNDPPTLKGLFVENLIIRMLTLGGTTLQFNLSEQSTQQSTQLYPKYKVLIKEISHQKLHFVSIPKTNHRNYNNFRFLSSLQKYSFSQNNVYLPITSRSSDLVKNREKTFQQQLHDHQSKKIDLIICGKSGTSSVIPIRAFDVTITKSLDDVYKKLKEFLHEAINFVDIFQDENHQFELEYYVITKKEFTEKGKIKWTQKIINQLRKQTVQRYLEEQSSKKATKATVESIQYELSLLSEVEFEEYHNFCEVKLRKSEKKLILTKLAILSFSEMSFSNIYNSNFHTYYGVLKDIFSMQSN